MSDDDSERGGDGPADSPREAGDTGSNDGPSGSGDGDTGSTTDPAALPSVEGMALPAAVDEIVTANPERDPDAVGRALSHVTDDGVVTRAAVDDALGRLSMVVSTPETRVELAAAALDDAREAADHVADLDAVDTRLQGFEARVTGVETDLATLQDSLREAVERGRDPDSLLAVGRVLGRVTADANDLQRRADEIQVDLEEFEAWLDDHGTRTAQIDEDADVVASTLDDLGDVADSLAAIAEDGASPADGDHGAGNADGAGDDGGDEPAVSVPGPVEVADPAVAWVDTSLRQRVVALLLADLRAECADLRTWADREGVEAGDATVTLDDLGARFDALEDRTRTLGDRLTDLAPPAWRDQFGDDVEAFDDRLADVAPPVDWAAVEATLADHRAAVLGVDAPQV